MPLGKISSSEIKKAYSILTELTDVIKIFFLALYVFITNYFFEANQIS